MQMSLFSIGFFHIPKIIFINWLRFNSWENYFDLSFYTQI